MNDAGRVFYVYKGEYSNETAYEALDNVLFMDSLFIAKKDVIGTAPPEYNEEGDETENEYWKLFLPGARRKGYIKDNDYATTEKAGIVKPDGDTITVDKDGTLHGSTKVDIATTEKAGIVKPDGKTITVDESGEITGSSIKTFETKADYEAAFAAGEVDPGMTVIITGDYWDGAVDSELSETSTNPVQNAVITAELNGIKDALGGITFSVTENGLVRASWED